MGGASVQDMRRASYLESSEIESAKKKVIECRSKMKR